MKLLALYIKYYRNCFKDILFNFSSDYDVTYSNNVLNIKQKTNNLPDFYGEHISDLSLIIGENGTGKTSVLNIIGNTMKERIKGLEYRDSKIHDRYFLVYLVSDNVYYIEVLGDDFKFSNISIRPKNDFAFSTYITSNPDLKENYVELSDIECSEYNSLYEKQKINDRIVYINENKSSITSSIFSLSQHNRWLLPRNNRLDISWEHWYDAYRELYKHGLIKSQCIKLRFIQTPSDSIEFYFKPENEEDIIDTIGNIKYIKESFHDFIAHNLNITVSILLESINSTNESFLIGINECRKKWKEYNEFTTEQISRIFSDLKILIDKERSFNSKGNSFIYEVIDLYDELYRSLLLIQDNIVTGIDDFELEIKGKEDNPSIRSFLFCLDMISDFIKNPVIDYRTAIENANYTEDETNDIVPKEFKRTNVDIIPLISQGEHNIITLFSRLKYELQYNINHTTLLNAVYKYKPCFLFLIDEVEAGMHIEWSRNCISQLVTIVDTLVFNNEHQLKDFVNLQFIMTTHSPFIVSDVLDRSIIELYKSDTDSFVIEKAHDNSFAQNIQTIISDDFYMNKYCGEYALQKIQFIIDILRNEMRRKQLTEDEITGIQALIEEIGEPIVRNKLKQMYKKYVQ